MSLDAVRCKLCGTRFDEHRSEGALCPPTVSWGKLRPFPRWPRLRDEARAGALFDRRLAAYWAKSRGTFRALP